MTTVLLAEPERLVRDVAALRLEEAGYRVIACPGPSAPDYTCLGTRGEHCPLAAAADLVVLDVELPGEDLVDAASGVDLLSYYTGTGKPVIALRAAAGLVGLFGEENITELEWPPAREDLLSAVRSALPLTPLNH